MPYNYLSMLKLSNSYYWWSMFVYFELLTYNHCKLLIKIYIYKAKKCYLFIDINALDYYAIRIDV